MTMDAIKSSVSKTLLIPLVARAAEAKKDNPVIYDGKAAEILEQINTEDIVVDGGEMATLGILARTKTIDDEIRTMLENTPDLTVINLGAGLDTRICRLDNGLLHCYEMDLPDVISLRRKFFAENERIHFIAGSVLNPDWAKNLGNLNCEKIVIVAEGLLMYFPEHEVERIFEILCDNFLGVYMYCDVVHSFFINKGISSNFRWGIEKAEQIKKVNARIQLIQSWSMGDLLKKRQAPMMRLMNVFPGTRNRSQILKLKLG